MGFASSNFFYPKCGIEAHFANVALRHIWKSSGSSEPFARSGARHSSFIVEFSAAARCLACKVPLLVAVGVPLRLEVPITARVVQILPDFDFAHGHDGCP